MNLPSFRFTLPDLIIRILDGRKRQTIRLFSAGSRLVPDCTFRLVDGRDRLIGTARLDQWWGMSMNRDSASTWALSDRRDRLGEMAELSVAQRHVLALKDGFDGPDAWDHLITVMDRFYVRGKGMEFPLRMIIIRWMDFQPGPGAAAEAGQMEMM